MLCFSAAAHAACLFAFAVVGLLANCTEEPDRAHIFELVSHVPAVSPSAPSAPSPRIPLDSLQSEASTPKDSTSTPAPDADRGEPSNSNPQNQRMTTEPEARVESYAIFAEKHNINAPEPSRASAVPRVQIHIDPGDYALPAISESDVEVANPNELDLYRAQVAAKLQATWERLLARTDLSSVGETQVEFRVSSSGVILFPKIERSSGNAAVNDLVHQVFRSVGDVAPPPRGYHDPTLRIVFRVK